MAVSWLTNRGNPNHLLPSWEPILQVATLSNWASPPKSSSENAPAPPTLLAGGAATCHIIQKPMKHGRFSISTGAGCLPSPVFPMEKKDFPASFFVLDLRPSQVANVGWDLLLGQGRHNSWSLKFCVSQNR